MRVHANNRNSKQHKTIDCAYLSKAIISPCTKPGKQRGTGESLQQDSAPNERMQQACSQPTDMAVQPLAGAPAAIAPVQTTAPDVLRWQRAGWLVRPSCVTFVIGAGAAMPPQQR